MEQEGIDECWPGLLFCGLILKDIPMLHKNSIVDANDVARDPVHGEDEVQKSSMHNCFGSA